MNPETLTTATRKLSGYELSVVSTCGSYTAVPDANSVIHSDGGILCVAS